MEHMFAMLVEVVHGTKGPAGRHLTALEVDRMAATGFWQDGALKHLLQLLWEDGWDNAIFSLDCGEDGSLNSWLSGFQVARGGLLLGAEKIDDGGAGTVVVKVESQEVTDVRVMEEHFTCVEILTDREIMFRVETLLERLLASG